MSAENVFIAIGPIGAGMGKIGGADLCGTQYFPVGFTLKELGDLYWGTRLVDVQCGATAEEHGTEAAFDGGVVQGPNAGTRAGLNVNGTWDPEVPYTPDVDIELLCTFNLFSPSPGPDGVCLAFDGSLWYPCIVIEGFAIAKFTDGGGTVISQVGWDSRVDDVSGTAGSASVMGKSVPLRYTEAPSDTGTASFAPPSLAFAADWPYT